jgi:hypothetical protein
MKRLVLLSAGLLLTASIAYGQCPGIYLYTDFERIGCAGIEDGIVAVIDMWAYAGDRPVARAEYKLSPNHCAVLTDPAWSHHVRSVVGDLLTGVTVHYSACKVGWHYLGNVEVHTSSCDSLVAEVVAHPDGAPPASNSPRLFGCPPPNEPIDVYGGSVFMWWTSHPPCELQAAPDLVIQHWEPDAVPDTAGAGGQIIFPSFTVRNWGCKAIQPSFTNGYYLSTDAVITPSDILLDSTPAVSGLGVYSDTTFSDTQLTIPPGTVQGEYHVGILADNTGAAFESDETNNYASTPLLILDVAAVGTDDVTPQPFGLLGNQPNPFTQTALIVFSLPEPAQAVLAIHDAAGRRIALLADRRFESGVHMLNWDGMDSSGRIVSPGVYFCRLEAGERFAIQKIVLVK